MQQLAAYWSAHQAQVISLALRLALAGIIYFACRLLSLLARKTITTACDRIDRLDITLAPILSSVASLLIYAIGLVAILDRFGVNANSLVAVIGAARPGHRPRPQRNPRQHRRRHYAPHPPPLPRR